MKKILLILALCFFCSGMLSAANTYDFIGNKKSKVYHKNTCWHIKQMNNDNIVYFDSAYEAKKEGYEPCGHCKPNLVKTEKPMPNNKIMLATKGERNAT